MNPRPCVRFDRAHLCEALYQPVADGSEPGSGHDVCSVKAKDIAAVPAKQSLTVSIAVKEISTDKRRSTYSMHWR